MSADATRRNLLICASWDTARWASWYFSAFASNNPSPFHSDGRSDVIDEIEQLFLGADEGVRRKMKTGVAVAILEWDIGLYNLEVLQLCAWTASRLRASECLPHLREIIIRHRPQLRDGEEAFFSTADDVISVLAEFGTVGIVEDLFSALLFDDDVTPRLSSLLAIGIVKASPSRFPEVFDRFYKRRCLQPEYFADESVVQQFAEAITPTAMAQQLHRLSLPAQEYILDLDVLPADQYFGFEIDDGRDTRGAAMPFSDREDNVNEVQTRYKAAQKKIARRQSPDSNRKRGVTDTLIDSLSHDAKTDIATYSGWPRGEN